MKKTCPIFFVLLLLQSVALGQAITSEDQLAKSMATEKMAAVASKNGLEAKAHIFQTGTSNEASISQRNATAAPNAAFIEQVGVFNSVSVSQQGRGNALVASQHGSRNSYNGEIDGINNLSVVQQNGSNNEINQAVSGRHLEYTLIQIGNNNTINQVETTRNAKPYKVVQQGNNMNITIEQSNIGLPPATGKK